MSNYANAITVAEWPRYPNKPDSEIIRIQAQIYKGYPCFALRIWQKNEKGQYQPTQSGINLSLAHAPKIITGLQTAAKQLKDNKQWELQHLDAKKAM